MPAASTTRRSVSSPHRPRAWFDFSTDAELLRLVRQRLALLRQQFQLLLHFAERGGLRGFALLQSFLIRFQLLLERLDQSFDGFLPLRQIAFGRFLEFAKRLFRQAAEIPARFVSTHRRSTP